MATHTSFRLALDVAAHAEWIVNNLVRTHYQYDAHIVPDLGVYDCDCNSFVAFVLERIAPAAFSFIPKETNQPLPRAFEYCLFFAGLDLHPLAEWSSIRSLLQVRRGDLLAWQSNSVNVPGKDTGHVAVAAGRPMMIEAGVVSLRVYDSAVTPHFEDTRGTGDGQPENGVGSGSIRFVMQDSGEPPAIQFGPSDPTRTPYRFSIGRLI
jgi:hypothetical protein